MTDRRMRTRLSDTSGAELGKHCPVPSALNDVDGFGDVSPLPENALTRGSVGVSPFSRSVVTRCVTPTKWPLSSENARCVTPVTRFWGVPCPGSEKQVSQDPFREDRLAPSASVAVYVGRGDNGGDNGVTHLGLGVTHLRPLSPCHTYRLVPIYTTIITLRIGIRALISTTGNGFRDSSIRAVRHPERG